MNNTMTNFSGNKAKLAGSLLLLALFVAPFLSFAKSDKIYVDDDASGTQDGSSNHPYKTIGDAMEKAGKGDQVYVRPGTYKENVSVAKEVELYGEDQNKVIIKADNDDKAVITLRHKSKVNNLTIKGGEVGVKVKSDSKATIVSCIIKENSHNGIEVEKSSSAKESKKVVISESLIENNKWNGIYAEKSYLVIYETQISENSKDGIGVSGGSFVWLEKSNIKENKGSGMKLTLDGSNIGGKNNRIADNNREGVEINSYGGAGKIDFKLSKIVKNDRYGIVRVIRGNASSAVFSGLTVQSNVEFWENKIGNISPIIRVR